LRSNSRRYLFPAELQRTHGSLKKKNHQSTRSSPEKYEMDKRRLPMTALSDVTETVSVSFSEILLKITGLKREDAPGQDGGNEEENLPIHNLE